MLLLVNITPLELPQNWLLPPITALIAGIGAYLIVLALIAIQNNFVKKWSSNKKGKMLFLANVELLFFFCVFYYALGSHRIFTYIPVVGAFQIFPTAMALCLYFLGIGIFHASSHRAYRNNSFDYAMLQVRMVLPFAIPFLLFTFILDLFSLTSFFPGENGLLSTQETLLLIGASIAFMILIMIFLPFFIQTIWKCKAIDNKELEERLEAICTRAHFKHAGMKTWTILQDSLTAGILGIVPRFRYVMFTNRLLKEFPPESVEAILAHEIGHSYRKHLIIYPFIIFGMLVCTGILSLFFSPALINFLKLENLLHPSFLWTFLDPLILFLAYVVIIVLYFRLVFGFFSRLFERQADLHVYELAVSPLQLIDALDQVAIATGYIHRVPNWHHYSIKQRIDFLKMTMESPQKIAEHHRRVKWSVAAYFFLLILGLLFLFAPLFDRIPLFHRAIAASEELSEKINQSVNHPRYQELAKKTIIEYGLKGNTSLILDTLVESYNATGGTNSFPIEGYYASKMLLEKGEISAGGTLLSHVWKSLTSDTISSEFINSLNHLTDQILSRLEQSNAYPAEVAELKEARLYAIKKIYK